MAELSLHDLFVYDEASPTCLTWKISPSRRTKCGHQAGTINKIPGKYPRSYYRARVNGGYQSVHRIVWFLHHGEVSEGMVIDHVDGNTLNNKISNLRLVTPSKNARNCRRQKNNNSGLTGVRLAMDKGKFPFYEAYAHIDGKQVRRQFYPKGGSLEEAMSRAANWREEQINQLNEHGAGYTERHGK
ncbi:HNH endonuclease signature motif containing protein [Atlantibacter hermannii]|uniref:HNH endonuclease signature motif containing protein n=1 Tax=Atlantibacter hermannii TaxID=565 RepID=UPI0028B205B5|nr:HNH endonuclease signature motif containing protein [Atlantibacter hermannii]